MDEQEYIRACKEGRLENFEALFNAYVEEIYRFLQYRVKNKEQAEDLTQDTFLKALKGIRGFKDGVPFRPWLYRIARNVLVDHYRAHHDTTSLDDDDALDVADWQDVEREADAKYTLLQVQDALNKLPSLQRDIVMMRVWDGLSYKEIAEILEKTEGNCKMIFSRAVVRLRDMVPLTAFVMLCSYQY